MGIYQNARLMLKFILQVFFITGVLTHNYFFVRFYFFPRCAPSKRCLPVGAQPPRGGGLGPTAGAEREGQNAITHRSSIINRSAPPLAPFPLSPCGKPRSSALSTGFSAGAITGILGWRACLGKNQ
jgi:hypothetical protein